MQCASLYIAEIFVGVCSSMLFSVMLLLNGCYVFEQSWRYDKIVKYLIIAHMYGWQGIQYSRRDDHGSYHG